MRKTDRYDVNIVTIKKVTTNINYQLIVNVQDCVYY